MLYLQLKLGQLNKYCISRSPPLHPCSTDTGSMSVAVPESFQPEKIWEAFDEFMSCQRCSWAIWRAHLPNVCRGSFKCAACPHCQSFNACVLSAGGRLLPHAHRRWCQLAPATERPPSQAVHKAATGPMTTTAPLQAQQLKPVACSMMLYSLVCSAMREF